MASEISSNSVELNDDDYTQFSPTIIVVVVKVVLLTNLLPFFHFYLVAFWGKKIPQHKIKCYTVPHSLFCVKLLFN
jgi:hypothetical protein